MSLPLADPLASSKAASRAPETRRRRKEFYYWLQAQCLPSPQRSTAASTLRVALMVAVIGWLDYEVGSLTSLSLFYVLPISFAVAWLGWRAGVVTSVVSVLVRLSGDLAAGGYPMGPSTVFWNRAIDVCNFLLLVLILHALFTLQRQLNERVRQRTLALENAIAARTELQVQLFEVSRRERSAIGRDLHDGLGQHLTATSFAADFLARELLDERHPCAEKARGIVRMAQEGIIKTKQIARGLLLAAIEPSHLFAELAELAAVESREHGVRCRFVGEGTCAALDVATSSHLYYIAREATRNALLHAAATEIDLQLSLVGGRIDLVVTDNGRGLPPASRQPGTGMGLRIMAHRAELIGGSLQLSPGATNGTRVRCQAPAGGLDRA